MAQDRALIRRRRILAFAEETTTGTAETLSAADATTVVQDREVQYDIQMVRRQQQGGFGYHKSVPGARMATLPFTVHAHGNGATGLPAWSTLLEACGFTESAGTYTLSAGTSTATMTMGLQEDGRVHSVAGAAGTFSFEAASGNPVPFNFEFTGKVFEPQAQSLFSPTYNNTLPPRFAAATLTVGGTAYKVATAGFNLNGEVTMREDATADDDAGRSGDGTGYHAAQVVNVDPVFTIDPEAAASSLWYEELMDADTLALSMILGADSNNTITIGASALQVRSAQPGDRNGLIVDTTELECTGSTLMTIAFS